MVPQALLIDLAKVLNLASIAFCVFDARSADDAEDFCVSEVSKNLMTSVIHTEQDIDALLLHN